MNATTNRDRLSRLLECLAEQLGVPPGRYREARAHYNAVGNWLAARESNLQQFSPRIYPQGSFAIGTAVRPVGAEEFDVECVCLLETPPSRPPLTQRKLKQLVGDRLKHPASRYRSMIDPPEGGRRCWTIRYAEGSKFHLDVLPAIPASHPGFLLNRGRRDLSDTAILITDTKTWDDPLAPWPHSDPEGYAEWFKSRMAPTLENAKQAHASASNQHIDDVRDLDVRTPLQQLVQILKRHRDLRYNGDEDKPVSIIITTLAAHAYRNESNLKEALTACLPRMRDLIQQRGDEWWVPNPVDFLENFADKWRESPRKAEVFLSWIEDLQQEV